MTERISIVTDEISQDLAECRAFCLAHRLSAVELRCVSGERVPHLPAADLETLEGWARDRDPVVLALSPGLFKCDAQDRATIRRELDDTLPRTLELARRLEARFIVTFAFDTPAQAAPPPSAAIDALAAAAEACAEADLPLLVENEPGFLACTAEELARLLAAAQHPNLYVNWDPSNSNRTRTEQLADALERIFPLIRHVHVKNGRLAPGERFAACCSLVGGEIDWPAHLAQLRDRGYAGYLGVETHYVPLEESSAIVVAELRAMLRALESEGRG